MSFIRDIKDVISCADEITRRRYFIKKMNRNLRVMAGLIILFVLFLNYWNVMEFISWSMVPLWKEDIRKFLNENMVFLGFIWLFYRFILEKGLRIMIISIDKSKDAVLTPVWFTINDVVDTFFSLYFLVDGINLLIEFCYGYSNLLNHKLIYLGALIYIISVFVEWLYIQNSNSWYYIRRKYTEFYDCEGKRIPDKAYVVYYGKRYQVRWSGDVFGFEDEGKKKEWRILSQCVDGKSFSLEEAVRDREGKLILDRWKWGEANDD